MLNSLISIALAASVLQPAPPAPRPAPCPPLAKNTVQALFASAPGAPVALRPVRLARDAVLAEETQHLGDVTWRTTGPVEIAQAPRHVFPAGSVVTLMRTPHGELQCFMQAAFSGEDPRGRTGTVTCLADADGDDRYETAQLMDVPGGTLRPIPLPAPVAFESVHPRDAGGEPFLAFRRVRLVSLDRDRARLFVEHRVAQGTNDSGFAEKPALTRMIQLEPGRVERIGGLDFRIERGEGGWTATPLAERFPSWVRFGCDNEAIVGGSDEE
ncbi:MAG TPA: hypothetical protein VF702_03185 [Allosphingosinicella sp.]|jgi:hypothetical protein